MRDVSAAKSQSSHPINSSVYGEQLTVSYRLANRVSFAGYVRGTYYTIEFACHAQHNRIVGGRFSLVARWQQSLPRRALFLGPA